MSTTPLHGLTRDELAVLVPELLLGGHLIDRSGLPHVLVASGREAMRDVAIEEWQGASPVYTRRMQRALKFEGDDVATIFKGLQLDIGAPPQFMDFRYTVYDGQHGEFFLAHCGALMDVEPLGEDYVRTMCHDIEDPTFDATAVATNPKAVMRPIHRPPRVPSERQPHCAWTVTINDANQAPAYPAQAVTVGRTQAALFSGVSPINPDEAGVGDYSGALWADFPFAQLSHSALVRLAEEVSLQSHLLSLSFRLALQQRYDDATVVDMLRKQFTGVAGVVAGRLRKALGMPSDLEGAAAVLGLHPAFNPVGYTGVRVEVEAADRATITVPLASPAQADAGWLGTLAPDHVEPIAAMLRGIDFHLQIDGARAVDGNLTVSFSHHPEAVEAQEQGEVLVTRVSTGAAFVLAGNRPLLTVLTG